MADTKDVKMKDFEDHSYFYKPYWFVVSLGFILWAAYVCWTGYWGIVHHRVPVIDLGMQVAILWWLLDTVLTKTVYRLEKDRLYMLKTGVGHKKELSIPYEDIFGVHHFKNQLMKFQEYYLLVILFQRGGISYFKTQFLVKFPAFIYVFCRDSNVLKSCG